MAAVRSRDGRPRIDSTGRKQLSFVTSWTPIWRRPLSHFLVMTSLLCGASVLSKDGNGVVKLVRLSQLPSMEGLVVVMSRN